MVELLAENEQNKEAVSDELMVMIKSVCEEVLREEECDFDAQISLTLTDNEHIQIINKAHRNIDAPTDVLSFPLLEFDESGNIVDDGIGFDGDCLMLGDIVLSLERAKEQSISLGHSFRREVAFLVAHSMLHLLGYDHIDDIEGEKTMCKKQDAVLGRLRITRDEY